MGSTVTALAERIQTEAAAYFNLEELRWPTGEPTCPHCGNVGADYIAPTTGTSRKTRTGSMSERRVLALPGLPQAIRCLDWRASLGNNAITFVSKPDPEK